MKKFTVILLIAVLAMTSVFAELNVSLSGDVTAEYDYVIDAKTYVYSTPNADAEVKFDFGATPAGVVGEGLRAEVAAKLAWTQADLANGDYFDEAIYLTTVSPKNTTDLNKGYFKFSVSEFAVKYYDIWTLNLLKATAVGNYAKSTVDFAKEAARVLKRNHTKNTMSFAYDNAYSFSTSKGVTFTWNGFTFAAAANGGVGDDVQKDFYVGTETPNFNLGNGFTLQGAGAFNYTGAKEEVTYDSWETVGSFKLAFAADFMKVAFNADNAITFGNKPNKEATKAGAKVIYDVDASLVAKFGPAADFAQVDVYYGKNVCSNNSTYSTPKLIAGTEFKNLLSAKVAFDFACFNAPIKATFAGLNLLNGAKILNSDFTITLAEKYVINAYGYDLLGTDINKWTGSDQAKYYTDNGNGQKLGLSTSLTFGPVVTTAEVYTRLANKTIGFGVGAEYTNDYFVATADVDAEFVAGTKASEKGLLTVAAGVESENIVKNATIGLSYESANLLPASYKTFSATTYEHGVGAIAAYATVSF